MADDKKPKIDLKARLGKTTAAPTPAPAPVAPQVTPSGRPMPMPQEVPQVTPSGRPMPMQAPVGLKVPTPMASAGGLPIPGGFAPPGQPGGYDPTNPLAAAVAAAPYQAQRAPAPPPEPQRIEIDDLTLKQVSGSALKKGIVIGAVFAVFLGGVGYVAGGASEQAAGRTKSKEGAADLAVNAAKARDQLKKLAEKMTHGRTQLVVNHKFPDTLSADLGGINVDFDGKQLEGRRFSGYSTDTTRELVEFITAVQGVNERKMLIQGLLNRLKKPITDQFSVPPGQTEINYVVAVDKDPHGNVAGFLSRLVDPITSPAATSRSRPSSRSPTLAAGATPRRRPSRTATSSPSTRPSTSCRRRSTRSAPARPVDRSPSSAPKSAASSPRSERRRSRRRSERPRRKKRRRRPGRPARRRSPSWRRTPSPASSSAPRS